MDQAKIKKGFDIPAIEDYLFFNNSVLNFNRIYPPPPRNMSIILEDNNMTS